MTDSYMAGDSDTQTFDQRAGQMFDPRVAAPPPSLQEAPGVNPQTAQADPGYNMQSVVEALSHAREGGEQLMAGQRENTRAMVGEMERGRRDLESVPIPKLEKSPTEPSTQQLGQGMMEFMQVATVLGGLAGGLARGNATVALTAFSGAVKGFAQGNKEQFDANLETWKAASERVKTDNQAKLDQYDLIWKNKKLSMDMKLGEIKAVAMQYHDEITYNLAERKDAMTLAMALERQQQFQLRYDDSHARLLDAAQRAQDAHNDHQQKIDDASSIADGVLSGNIPPDMLGSYGSKNMIEGKLARSGKPISKLMLEWLGAKKQVQSLNGPQMQRFAGAAISVVNSIDEVKALSQQLKESGVPLANRAKLLTLVQTEGNTPRGQLASRYLAAVAAVKSELANVEQGGYAPTESAWEQARAQVNGDFGTAQMEATLSEVQRLLRYRINAIPNFQQLGPLGANRFTGQSGNPPSLLQPDQQPAAGVGNEVDDAMKRLGF